MSAYRTPAEISETELRGSELFKEADRDVIEAFQRVLVSRVSDHPMGFAGPRVDWTEFEQSLARFCDMARLRHIAKHNAMREAMLVTRPIIVVREEGSDAKLLEGGVLPADLVDWLRNGG